MKLSIHQILTKISSPAGIATVLGLFAIYALVRYIVFPFQGAPASENLTVILLASQFATTMSLLVIARAARDRRIFEAVFVLLVMLPALSIATNAAIYAATGMPLQLESLTSSVFLFNPLVLSVLAIQVLLAGAIFLWLKRRARQGQEH